MGEAFQFPQNVGPGALAGFHEDEQRARDLANLQRAVNVNEQSQASRTVEQEDSEFRTSMMGVAHQDGAQHDLDPRGFTSDDTVSRAIDYQQAEWNQLDELAQVRGGNATPGNDYQRLYGQSENEKGELRRALQEQMEANQRILAQMQQLQYQPQVAPPNFFGPNVPQNQVPQGPNVPQAQYSYVPPVVPQADPRFKFVDKDDNEMVMAGEVNEAIRTQVAPYVIDAYNRAAAAEQRSIQANERLFMSQKVQMGITPQIEQLALAQQPWIRNIQDPQAYLGAMFNFKEQLDRQRLLQRTNPTFTPPRDISQRPAGASAAPGAGQRIIRRSTFIEGQGQQMAGEAGQNANAALAQWEAAWAATMQLPFSARADEQRKLLQSRGVSSVSGYRDPMTLSR